jgi:hypothetical protein
MSARHHFTARFDPRSSVRTHAASAATITPVITAFHLGTADELNPQPNTDIYDILPVPLPHAYLHNPRAKTPVP